ncbi:MAG: hypothetical protein OXI35_11490 [Gemmatimonadota bacterium]|nr:hypothetical protein [Gemmatimonadota bacterium]
MAIFVIALNNPADSEFRKRIATHYPQPRSYEFSDSLFFVSEDNIPQVIAEVLGIRVEKEEERIAKGVVFRLNGAYSGFTQRALWDWLNLAEEHEK